MNSNCDTMVALSNTTINGQTIFAKNSDRPPEESQPLVQKMGVSHRPDDLVNCQFLNIPQVERTYAHIGSRPYWCWGYEHGFNEFQVVIGNEGLASKLPISNSPKLIGMEILRLALERSRTASHAVEVMTSLIGEYGQGKFSNGEDVRTYDNGYIVADPKEAYVIETAGHEWVVKQIDSVHSISNQHSIRMDWDNISPTAKKVAVEGGLWPDEEDAPLDFAAAYCDFFANPSGLGAVRQARSTTILNKFMGRINVKTMFSLLTDHSECGDVWEDFVEGFPSGRSICTHYSSDICGDGNTAASLVADLCNDGSRLPVYWHSLYSPCIGPFLPIFGIGNMPATLSKGAAVFDNQSPWWLFRELEKRVRTNGRLDNEKALTVRKEWKSFQLSLIDSAYKIASHAKKMQEDQKSSEASMIIEEYTSSNLNRALEIVNGLLL